MTRSHPTQGRNKIKKLTLAALAGVTMLTAAPLPSNAESRGSEANTQVPSASSTKNSSASSNTAYINAIYRGLIGRLPTAPELASAQSLIANHGRAAFTNQLTTSDVWLGHFIDDLYDQAFSRAPDNNGRKYWIQQLRNGASTVDIAASVLGSTEFRQQEGGTDRSVADGLYRRVLGREPGVEGLNFWEQQLAEHGVGHVSREFFQSKENRLRRVGLLYQNLLCRPGDTRGADYWAGLMASQSDHVLSLFLVGSDEFAANAIKQTCRGETVAEGIHRPIDGHPGIQPLRGELRNVTKAAQYAYIALFDTVAGEIVISPRPYGESSKVEILSSNDGHLIRSWGADGTKTIVADVSRDGRYLLLQTTDPALAGGPVTTNYYSHGELVLVDRNDDTFVHIPTPIDHIEFAQMSDNAQVLWLTTRQDSIDNDGYETENFAKSHRFVPSTGNLQLVTNGNPSDHEFITDASADGSRVLIASETGTKLRIYDSTTNTDTEVPFEFRRHGTRGRLNAAGDRVVGLEGYAMNKRTILFDVSTSAVEVLGAGYEHSAGDITDDGSTVVWVKSFDLEGTNVPQSTTVGVRRAGQADWTFEVPFEVHSLELSQSGNEVAIKYRPVSGPDDLSTIAVVLLD